jgi:hypothetical protein
MLVTSFKVTIPEHTEILRHHVVHISDTITGLFSTFPKPNNALGIPGLGDFLNSD